MARVVSLMGLIALGVSPAVGQLSITPVVLTGQPVPGVPGATFGLVGEMAQVDQQGNVCVSGRWAGSPVQKHGLFTGVPGMLEPKFVYSALGPAGPDGTWAHGLESGATLRFVFGEGGRFAAQAIIGGAGVNGSNDRAILSGDITNPIRVARTGSAANGAAAPWSMLNQRPVMNASGAYSIIGSLDTNNSFIAIAVGSPNMPATVIAQTNDPVPGAPAGSTYTQSIWHPVISDTGSVAYTAGYRENATTFRAGVFIHQGGVTQRLASSGQLVPSTPGLSSSATFTSFLSPSIGRSGHVAFAGEAGVAALWATDESGSNLRGIASAAAPLPGSPGTTLLSLGTPNVGPTGDIAFVGRYTTGGGVTGGTDERLWKHQDGETSLWLTEGVQAPNQPAGVRVSFSSMFFTELNANGQVAFLSDVFGTGVTAANRMTLFTLDAAGNLQTIARAGTLFEVGPGDVRTIQFIDLASPFMPAGANYGLGGMGGGPRALADDGTLVFSLRFTNATSGVFSVTIPHPGTLPVLVSALCIGALRRRRSHCRSRC